MSTESNTDHQRRRAARVWDRMTEVFGARWASTRGETPPGAWVAGVAMLSDDEVRHGLRAVVTEWISSNGPPDWPEFRDLARPPDARNAEQRVRDARIAREQPERLCLPGASEVVARMPAVWFAWRILNGHAPVPAGRSVVAVYAVLRNADYRGMCAKVLSHRQGEAAARGMDIDDLPGASPGPWLRAA